MNEIGIKIIRIINSIINFVLLIIVILLLAFACYALWDSRKLHQAADKSNYEIFKPTIINEGKSFKELQAINEDVFAWLTIYDTNIDYPVTQGRDNMQYVNTNAEGLYSLSGAIFLDYRNNKNFTDFNNIIYGHHMQKKTMFGEIGEFADKDMFDSHPYGNLYFNEKDHTIEFFAFIHTDAYNGDVFTPNIQHEEDRQKYLDNLLETAIHIRDSEVTIQDNIILLTTCSSTSTNGRDILIGRIVDEISDQQIEIYQIQCIQNNENGFVKPILLIQRLMFTMLILILLYIIFRRRKKQKQDEQ